MSEIFKKAVKEAEKGLASLGEIPRKLGLNIPTMKDIEDILSIIGPQADIKAMVEESSRVIPALKKGDIPEALGSLGLAALAPFMIGIPGTTSGIKKGGLRLIQGGKKDSAKKGLSELGEEVPEKTEKQKYNKALREQELSRGFAHLDDYMITDGEVVVNRLTEDMNISKSTEDLVGDLEFVLGYVDWMADYLSRKSTDINTNWLQQNMDKQNRMNDFFHTISAEIEKRMK